MLAQLFAKERNLNLVDARSITANRTPADVLRGFFWLCHPGPVVFFGIAVTAFALLASWPRVPWKLLGFAIAAHLVMQLSISIFNDYCDRQRDRWSEKNKPIVRGLVRPREALIAGLVLMAMMVLLLLPLNRVALVVSVLYLALGQSYNLGLKTTPFGGLAVALAIPLIPVYAFVAVNHFVPLALWQIPITVLLGLALHLANATPDLDQDTANRSRNLAVMLGRKRSIIATSALIVLAAFLMIVFAVAGLVPVLPLILLPSLLLALLATGLLSVFFGAQRTHQADQNYFYLVVLTCLVLAGGWIASALSV